MAEQSFSIEFGGYWRDENKGSIPSTSGIYCVYTCTYAAAAKTVDLKKLVYIGESGDVNARIANHEKYPAWKKHLKAGEQLCFSHGPVASANRARCEAAMIFKHKPPENTEYVNDFPFDKTYMSLAGKIALLTATFTVNRT